MERTAGFILSPVSSPPAPRTGEDFGGGCDDPRPAVLEPRGAALYCGLNKELSMLALYIILGFVAVLAAINFIEFGRVD